MAIDPNTPTQRQKRQRHAFLHTFFPSPVGYQEIQVNGYWLVNHINGDTKLWEVAIFDDAGFKNYKIYRQASKPML